AQGRNHGPDFFMAQHLVVAGLFHVEDLALKRQHCLEFPVPPLLSRPACGLALDQVQLAAVWITLTAVGQLARQTAAIERTFAPRQVTCFPGRLTRTRSLNRLVDDPLRDG